MATIGILGIGEMGAAWARLLRRHGQEVLTYLDDRSERTKKRAQEAAVASRESVEALVRDADVVVSLVPTSAADPVADAVARAIPQAHPGLLFVEANAIAPGRVQAIARRIEAAGGRCVDAAVLGLARGIGNGTLVIASGPHAEALQAWSAWGFRVRVLGPEVGQASALKMLNAGLTKGLTALLLELLLTARGLGCLQQVMDWYDEAFGGLVKRVALSITGLPVHARRRAEEMEELAGLMAELDLAPTLAEATRRVLLAVASAAPPPESAGHAPEVTELLALLAERGALKGPTLPE
ncbi:MAG: NAD(P)-dependent oxidoreductase [Deltaproteobacteria bacterium]|nr:NAD(P)-dependent oxidoreductase [Deltaproteobacteria bacterium]MBI3076350.1 NAD(P)-dependent oxidoreductase [Deltaproteobacteria bacterium]